MGTLVTGASGFIGHHLFDALRERGDSVRVLIRDPAAAERFREPGAEVQVGDVRQPQVLTEAVRGADVVYHCAAAAGPATTPREAYDIALTGTRNLLEALRQAGSGRAVLLTGVIVLGARHLDGATEDLPHQPSGDPAADVKIAIEQLAQEYEQRHGVDVVVLRPGLVYGPGDRRNLPQMIRAVRRGKFAFIRSRDHLLPLVHVGDMVRAMMLAAGTPAAQGRAYHITDGSRTTIGEFIDCLAALLGCPPPRKVLPFAVPYLGCLLFESLAALRLYRGPAPIGRTGLNYLGYSRSIDITRARQELGYEPRVSYRDGLPLTLKANGEQP